MIVEKAPGSNIQEIDKRKFLVPSDISIAQFMWIIRQRIQLPAEKAIFLFVGKVLPQSRCGNHGGFFFRVTLGWQMVLFIALSLLF